MIVCVPGYILRSHERSMYNPVTYISLAIQLLKQSLKCIQYLPVGRITDRMDIHLKACFCSFQKHLIQFLLIIKEKSPISTIVLVILKQGGPPAAKRTIRRDLDTSQGQHILCVHRYNNM